MTNVLDDYPDAKAYVFNYRFRVGHALRAARTSQLRIEAERHFEEVRLFLDPAGLVEGIEDAAESVNASPSLGPLLASGNVHAIPVVEWKTEAGSVAPARIATPLSGLMLSIPAGTKVAVSASPVEHADAGLWIRFPHDTSIEIGGRGANALRKFDLRGLQPVLLNGNPVLEVNAKQTASVLLHMTAAKTAILSLAVIVSPYRRRGADALYHIVEAIGDRVVGGTSIQIRV